MSDFNGEVYDFAAGTILGMRSWQMDSKGRLCGVTHAEVWRPGENVASCKKEGRVPCPDYAKKQAEKTSRKPSTSRCGCGCGLDWADVDHVSYSLGSSVYWPEPCGKNPRCGGMEHPAPPQHTFDPDCQCGFWAYDDHGYKPHGEVSGVIEGYGKTTIGTRGFRCEKARIVALCREHDLRDLSLSAWLRLKQLYPEAKFYDDADEMVEAHGGVMHSWGAVEDGFWDEPAAIASTSLGLSLSAGGSSFMAAMSRAATYSPPTRYLSGGSGA